MFDSKKELQAKIRLGEDTFLEFKEVRFAGNRVREPHVAIRWPNELASFANSRGGVFVLGIDDQTHEVLGIPLEQLDAVEQYVFEIVQDSSQTVASSRD